MLNVLQAHGYIDVNDGEPIPNPSQEFLRFWQEKLSGLLPGSTRIPDPVDEDMYDREINEQILTIAIEEGIIDEDLAARAREAEDMNAVLPPEVTEAFNNPNDPLWKAAYQRVSIAKAGIEGVRMTSVCRELGRAIEMAAFMDAVAERFGAVYGRRPVEVGHEALARRAEAGAPVA